jgi:hypothetical protein
MAIGALNNYFGAATTLQISAHIHMHRLNLAIRFQSSLSQLSSNTAELDSCKILAISRHD